MPNAELCKYCTDGWLLLGTNGGGGAKDSKEVWGRDAWSQMTGTRVQTVPLCSGRGSAAAGPLLCHL